MDYRPSAASPFHLIKVNYGPKKLRNFEAMFFFHGRCPVIIIFSSAFLPGRVIFSFKRIFVLGRVSLFYFGAKH